MESSEARAISVEELRLFDYEIEPSYDRIVRLLRQTLRTRMAAFSVIDQQRQFFRAQAGFNVRESPSELSFCRKTVEQEGLFVVQNADQDVRFRGYNLVTGEPHVRFYAGLPVRAPNGIKIGTLCAMDTQAFDFNRDEIQALQDFHDLLEEALLIRSVSVRDSETGLLNRRQFDELFQRASRQAYRHLVPLTLLLIRLGPSIEAPGRNQNGADTLMLRAAGVLQTSVRRAGDVVARFSSNQFVVVMPNLLHEAAQACAERVREALLIKLQKDHPRLGVEVGGVTAEHTIGLHGALVKAALDALHQVVKQGGTQPVIVRL